MLATSKAAQLFLIQSGLCETKLINFATMFHKFSQMTKGLLGLKNTTFKLFLRTVTSAQGICTITAFRVSEFSSARESIFISAWLLCVAFKSSKSSVLFTGFHITKTTLKVLVLFQVL